MKRVPSIVGVREVQAPRGGLQGRIRDITRKAFELKDCALITLATGLRAQTLRELADRVEQCHPASIEYHFYSSQLRPSFDDPEYHNDFALWARDALRDQPLAERLAILDPLQHGDIEALRQALLDVILDRLSDTDLVPWAPREHEFIFLRAQTVVFDTGLRANSLPELAGLIPRLATGSIYYHFVEARRRLPGRGDDFGLWITSTQKDCDALAEQLAALDYYYASLTELRGRLAAIFADWIARHPGKNA